MTVLRTTTSMSYSRYFRIAMPIAPYRPIEANRNATETHASLTNCSRMITPTNRDAASANQRSCRRSSPRDPWKRIRVATSATTARAATRNSATNVTLKMRSTCGSSNATASLTRGTFEVIAATVAAANALTTSTELQAKEAQSTGRHLREWSFPVGKSRSRRGSDANARLQDQAESQSRTAAPGRTAPSTCVA